MNLVGGGEESSFILYVLCFSILDKSFVQGAVFV